MLNKINSLGENCPIPVIKAKNALKEMKENEKLVILVDNYIATENLYKMAKELGYELVANKMDENCYECTIIKGKKNLEKPGVVEDSVVVISSDTMGQGDKELGYALLKGFIYALTELDNPPKTMLFYNSGAYMTTDKSQSLDDLKQLKEKGVEILTCGACLNFYGLSDKLVIGDVTIMYSIAGILSVASKIIKP